MAGRPHLALVPAQVFRPALALPWARVALALAVCVGALGLLYLVARETPLFAVRTVEVSGAPAPVRDAVRTAAARWEGTSLVALDGEDLRRRLEALPSVRSLQYDRSFPHTLAITVVPERPAAVVRRRGEAWVVSETGRVIRAVEPAAGGGLPRIRPAEDGLSPGVFVRDADARLAVRAATRIPDDFPARVRAVHAREQHLTLRLVGGTDLRLGNGSALPLKLAVAARVLRSLTPEERRTLAYVDVSLPERPVGFTDSQLSG